MNEKYTKYHYWFIWFYESFFFFFLRTQFLFGGTLIPATVPVPLIIPDEPPSSCLQKITFPWTTHSWSVTFTLLFIKTIWIEKGIYILVETLKASITYLRLPHPLAPWASLALWGLRKPWEPLEAFSIIGASVRLQGLVPLTPCPLVPLSLSLPGPLGPLWGLKKPLEAFSSLGASVRLKGLLPFGSPCLPCPFAPNPSWIPGAYLGPQKALGTFGNLWQPWDLTQFQEPFSSCSSLPPHSSSSPEPP